MTLVYWQGTPPTKCQITGREITSEFIDGVTSSGRWAIMHPETHRVYGYGLGEGRGQRYIKENSGNWRKV